MHVHGGNGATFHCPSTALEPALVDGQVFIRQDQIRVNLHKDTQAGTLRTCAVGIIKREHPRRQFFNTGAMFRTSIVLAEGIIFFWRTNYDNSTS